MNWGRQINSELERELCSNASTLGLEFLQSMPSVAERYASRKLQRTLDDIVSAVMLNAIDAYVINSKVVLSKNAEPDSIWGQISSAVNALEITGQLSVSRNRLTDDMAITLSPSLVDRAKRIKAKILDHSQQIDVHRWSDHPEANIVVDEIYARYFEGGNLGIRRKHLKVVLLDLYVRWVIDPTLKTAVSFNVDSYKAGSRYNAIHLSKLTIEIVKRLAAVGLVDLVKGFNRGDDNGRVTRIWPTPELIRLFEQARFGIMDVGKHADEEVIILRTPDPEKPTKQIDTEYTDDDSTNEMRERLKGYNALIASTFVDIPTLEMPFVELAESKRLHINQSDKFTRRIFNRGSFEKGGRFYGGWWQRCPEEVRKGIFLNDKATVEVDYSGLHIVTLYANKGIDYWREVGSDPYEVYVPEFGEGLVPRSICKLLMLVAINAKDETSAFQAFRSEAETGSAEKGIGNGILRLVLDGLRKKHAAIAHHFADDAGIDLMNQDGQITDKILTAFTDAAIPILSIHDSYIVPVEYVPMLLETMRKAFTEVTGQPNVRVEPSRIRYPGNTDIWLGHHPAIPPRLSFDRNGKLTPSFGWKDGADVQFPWANPARTARYVTSSAAFAIWAKKEA